MKILHYTLGLPPYRSGGLTKYSHDLMVEQAKQGNKIYLLFPGKMSGGNTKIKYYSKYKDINVYELINPLPVPLLNGTSKPLEFMRECSKSIFVSFLNDINIDILHVHTFMGLYKELLEACKELNIKITYTTHDYYGLCTKVNFIDYNGHLCNERDLDKCIRCNYSGYSMKIIKILQSDTYRFLKNKGIVTKAKNFISRIRRKKEDINLCTNANKLPKGNISRIQYKKLIEYYKLMYSYIDRFLFNSTVAKGVYDKYLHTEGDIIPITHNEIRDNRIKKCYKNKELKLTYLGPNKQYKGFYILVDIMKSLEVKGYREIVLNAYGDNDDYEYLPNNMKINGKYSYKQLKKIFDDTDLLLVPSIWNETFGFIALEALSYGVPVLLTDKVGSKDIVNNSVINKGIVTSVSKSEIRDEIIKIFSDRDILKKLNDNILKDSFYGFMKDHYYRVNSAYNKTSNILEREK